MKKDTLGIVQLSELISCETALFDSVNANNEEIKLL
jgi:hypothetical protein